MAKVSQDPSASNFFIKLLTNAPRQSLRNCVVSMGALLALLDEGAEHFFKGDTGKGTVAAESLVMSASRGEGFSEVGPVCVRVKGGADKTEALGNRGAVRGWMAPRNCFGGREGTGFPRSPDPGDGSPTQVTHS